MTSISTHRLPALRRAGRLLPLAFVIAAAACSAADDTRSELGASRLAAAVSDCGYTVAADIHGSCKRGFHAKVRVTNVSGDPSKTFSVLISAGSAQLVHVAHGTFEVVEGGYLLHPRRLHDRSVLDQGETYTFELKLEGTYTVLVPYILSNNGTSCDQTPPQLNLGVSGDFFTSAGILTLTAQATDDVAVAKVVFSQDGEAIGTVTTAPYTLAVPVTSALNGRHRYQATAYDVTGNPTSVTKRVLVAIGNKFFGTAVTSAADYPALLDHFDQVTPGNAGKWGSVEAVRGEMNWTELDAEYQFAKTHQLPFKLHTLVWGQQQPSWIASLSAEEQLAELEQWMAALAERYPAMDMIDVVNEPMHAPPSYAAALGGSGATGWDWVVKAFEMARAHFPNAELLLNEYYVLPMASLTADFLKVVQVLSDRGLIDGIGEQGHFYERAELPVIQANLATLAATGLPIYISELDINFADDARQALRMSELFPIFWQNPSVLGVTHWGYRQGSMWQVDSYLMRTDGTARPALAWLDCYLAGGTNCYVPPYVPKPRTGASSGITLEAEDYDAAQGLLAAGTMVAYADEGDWVRFDRVAFDGNWDTLSVTYARGATQPASLTVHFDSLDSAPVATFPLAFTGSDWVTMKTVSIPWAPVTGERNVFVRFVGGGANVDKIQLAAPTGTGKNLIADSDFEQGSTGGFWTWGSGTIANTTARAITGTHSLALTGRTDGGPLVAPSPFVPGKTYKVSLWATIAGSTPATAYVTTAIQCTTDAAPTYGRLGGWGNSKTVSDGTWVELAGDIAIPDCELAQAIMYVEGVAANIDLTIDHVSVRQQSTSNIVPNGTFESGTSGWYSWSGGTVEMTTTRAHGGAASLLVTGRDSNGPAATNLTSVVKPGTAYPFSLWVSIDSPDGTSKSINVTASSTCADAGGGTAWIGGPVNVPDDGSWVQIAGTLSVPSCNLTGLQLWVEGGAGANLYVDDVQILDTAGDTSNLIADGTFESGQGAWGGWGFDSLAVVNTSAHGGQQSLMATEMAQYGAISRDIKALVTAGKRYQASAWVSVGNLAAGSGAVKLQTVQDCDGSGDSYPWLAGATINNGAWVQVTGTVDLSACTTIAKLQLFVGADSGNLYVDDVTLSPLP